MQRQQFQTFLRKTGHSVRELPMGPSPEFGAEFWQWIQEIDEFGEPAVLLAPKLPARELSLLTQVLSVAEHSVGINLQLLPEDAGLSSGVLASSERKMEPVPNVVVGVNDVEAHSRAWVRRTLTPSGLGLCPYTASDRLAGVKLESQGVSAAPILHAVSSSHTSAGLLADVWSSICEMVQGGEAEYSSIVLSAPAFDDRWEV